MPQAFPQRSRDESTSATLPTLAAAGAIGEAVVHIPLLESHLTEAPYIGVGFLLLIVAGFTVGTKLLVAPDKRAWALCGLVATLALLGYILSRTVGLPQIHDDIGDWQDPLGTLAILCEFTMLVATLVQLAVRPVRTGRGRLLKR
jgi:hypothetical protein